MFFNCPSPCGQYNKVAESTLDPWPRLTGQQVDDTLKGRRCLPLLARSWQVKNSLVLAVSLTVWPGKTVFDVCVCEGGVERLAFMETTTASVLC